MICLLALIIFGVLGIFSASYRTIAKEAFDCVFRRLTLRKCTSGLDKRLKAQLTGKVMKSHPKTGLWLFKHFEVLSWMFTLLLVVSLAYSAYAVYNYAAYGNCNGPGSTGFCLFNGLDAPTESCSLANTSISGTGPIVYPSVDDDPFLGPENASIVVIEFGCFSCPYSKQSVPIIDYLHSKHPDVKIVFRDFPLDNHADSTIAAQAAACADLQGKYWQYWRLLFENQQALNGSQLKKYAGQLGLDTTQFANCLDSNTTRAEVTADFEAGLRAEVKGTPTFFINNRTIVGPQHVRVFDKIIKEERAKAAP